KYMAMLTRSNEQVYRQKIRALLFMIVLGMLTPVIFIHEVVKGEIGRARPRHVEQFSGTNSFTAAWVKSEACRGDCSFTSGHVAFGAWLMAAWYLGGRQRWLFLSLGAAITCLIGWLRMAQGAHFLTDVIGSVLLVWLTAHLLSIAAPCGAKYRTNNNDKPQQQRL
ncbi:MAG: phosphatase PAP2 family protein, partial [Burkholderiales bacterium]